MAPKSLTELAKEVFIETNKDLTFKELWSEIVSRAQIPASQNLSKMASFYTTLSTNGDFFFDKQKKTWGLVNLHKFEDVKKNRTEIDIDDAKDGDEDEYVEEEDADFDDEASNELGKKTNKSADDDVGDSEEVNEDL